MANCAYCKAELPAEYYTWTDKAFCSVWCARDYYGWAVVLKGTDPRKTTKR